MTNGAARRRALAGLLLSALLGGCGGEGASEHAAGVETATVPQPREVVVAERWVSVADTLWNLDTPDLWVGGDSSLVLVTGKGSHTLHLFDGATGEEVGVLGDAGPALGQFQRPNAVLVEGDLAFVIERDNRRVQLLRLPSGEPVSSFGEDVLVKPYGGVVVDADGERTLWVTDDYDVGLEPDLTRRLHRFSLGGDNGVPIVTAHAAYGDASGAGALEVVESIQADPDRGRIFVADETKKAYLGYDLHGTFTGEALARGHVSGDPEGIALVECGEAGYWIVTDQQDDVSWFRLFDRLSLEYLGAFRGEVTTNTDGMSFEPGPVPGFPSGAVYAVHDDQALAAFDWADVTKGLGLGDRCFTAEQDR